MQPIANVNLNECLTLAEEKVLSEEKGRIITKLKELLTSLKQATADVVKLEKEIKKANEKLAKLTEKYEKVKAGDWSVLQEEKEAKPQEEQNA